MRRPSSTVAITARPKPTLTASRLSPSKGTANSMPRKGCTSCTWLTVRVSQVQLVQPFLGMLFAVPLLGEGLDAVSVGFGLAVMATVLLGRRMPVRARAPQG